MQHCLGWGCQHNIQQYDMVRNAKQQNSTLHYSKRLEYTIKCIQLGQSYWNWKGDDKCTWNIRIYGTMQKLLLRELIRLKATTSLDIELALNLSAELVATRMLNLRRLEYWIGQVISSVFLPHHHGTVRGLKWSGVMPGALLIPSSTLMAWSISAWSGGHVGILRVWWGTEVPRLLAAE